ncbi:tryptophan--tRNA ligase [uncultured Vagococcus sp.]|uniref:tryptophan--tRNA ligase n=1 Tax=uncultured Vagococcus sp. TaxID=189676 RepID=UPI0028D86AFE|nr:tryptophan--tRNA ligase [uncultured Vagococcus sp.]
MSVVFSGIKPSGELTLGNYLGAMAQFLTYQEEEAYFCIVNQHAITVPQEAAELRQQTRRLAALYLASGLDPEKVTIFIQSEVPAHAQLAWIMTTLSQMGELERMTQYKEKAGGLNESIPAGLLTYPPFMAADILLYQADVVPVGDDQQQHLELTRTLAQRFNYRFGETFKLPVAAVAKETTRVMSLQDPLKKMSKSAEDSGTILLLDSPAVITKKIKRAVTDSENKLSYDPESKPGVSNLMAIYASISGLSYAEIEQKYADIPGYGQFKLDLAELVVGLLEPIQRRYGEIMAGDELDDMLTIGAQRASRVANKNLHQAEYAMGLSRR